MLENCFLHLPSIGLKSEKKLWQSGIKTLDDFIRNPPIFIQPQNRKKIIDYINKDLKIDEPHHYYDNLPSSEQWRIFKRFQKETAYIDIETTGLDVFRSKITTIVLYDGKNIKHYVNGKNLDEFKKDLFDYKIIVTYNGKTFDVPVIENFFKIKLNHCHLDLRYILKSIGYSGGLKSCENQLGIHRQDGLGDINGSGAVQIWQYYRRQKNEKALETLLAYNAEDVLNLEYLMVLAYNEKIKSLPIELENLGIPPKKKNPFQIDPAIVKKFQQKIPDIPKNRMKYIYDGYWVWIESDILPSHEFTGKYLFFSEDRNLLIKIAIDELMNGGFNLAKTHDENIEPPSGEYVLCLYDKNDSRKHELAEKYRHINGIKYRYWKSNEDTIKGRYSKIFLQKQKAKLDPQKQKIIKAISYMKEKHYTYQRMAEKLNSYGKKNFFWQRKMDKRNC